jgi:hypothetical protein
MMCSESSLNSAVYTGNLTGDTEFTTVGYGATVPPESMRLLSPSECLSANLLL